MSAIYRNSPLPRYYQLKEILRERARSGEWKPGDLIPSERELSEKYGISRMRSEEHTSELQSRRDLVCRLLLEKKKEELVEINADRLHQHLGLLEQEIVCNMVDLLNG